MKWISMPRFLLRKNMVDKIIKHENLKGKTCLEIGYGSGEMLRYFSKKGAIMYGYDFSDEAFLMATERTKDLKNIHLLKSLNEVNSIKFDYIFSFEVLEHIKDDNATIFYWSQILTNNGKIILSVPSKSVKYNKLDQYVGHYRKYNSQDIKQIFENNKMKIITLWHYGFPISNIVEEIRAFAIRNKDFSSEEKEELSKVSFKSNVSMIIPLFSNDIFLYPLYLIQQLFKNFSWGSGILCLCEKNRGN